MEKYSDLIAILKERVASLAEQYRIVYAIVFGSVVDGRMVKGESDIDLAIEVKGLDRRECYDFKKKLDEIGLDNVDMVIINFALFSICYDILTKGKILFCRDYDELFEDRLKIIKLYDDWINLSKFFEEREVKKVFG